MFINSSFANYNNETCDDQISITLAGLIGGGWGESILSFGIFRVLSLFGLSCVGPRDSY